MRIAGQNVRTERETAAEKTRNHKTRNEHTQTEKLGGNESSGRKQTGLINRLKRRETGKAKEQRGGESIDSGRILIETTERGREREKARARAGEQRNNLTIKDVNE